MALIEPTSEEGIWVHPIVYFGLALLRGHGLGSELQLSRSRVSESLFITIIETSHEGESP